MQIKVIQLHIYYICMYTYICVLSRSVVSDSLWPHGLQPTRLLCPWGCLQARILEWVVMPSSRGSSQPRDRTQVSLIAGRFFTIGVTREAPFVPNSEQKLRCGHWRWPSKEVWIFIPDSYRALVHMQESKDPEVTWAEKNRTMGFHRELKFLVQEQPRMNEVGIGALWWKRFH